MMTGNLEAMADVASLFSTSNLDCREELVRLLLSDKVWQGLSQSSQSELQSLLPAESSREEATGILCDRKRHPFWQLNSVPEVLSSAFPAGALPASSAENAALRSLRFQEKLNYERWIRKYNVKMLQSVLIKRKAVLRSRFNLADGDKIPASAVKTAPVARTSKRTSVVWKRAVKRCRLIINDVKQAAGDAGNISSDDETEADAEMEPNLWKLQRSDLTAAGTISHNCFRDLSLNQEVQLDAVDEMLRCHKHLVAVQPDHPSLEFSDVSLMDVVRRAQMESFVQKFAPSVIKSSKLKESTTSDSTLILEPVTTTAT